MPGVKLPAVYRIEGEDGYTYARGLKVTLIYWPWEGRLIAEREIDDWQKMDFKFDVDDVGRRGMKKLDLLDMRKYLVW